MRRRFHRFLFVAGMAFAGLFAITTHAQLTDFAELSAKAAQGDAEAQFKRLRTGLRGLNEPDYAVSCVLDVSVMIR
jgi:hypothetical protein